MTGETVVMVETGETVMTGKTVVTGVTVETIYITYNIPCAITVLWIMKRILLLCYG